MTSARSDLAMFEALMEGVAERTATRVVELVEGYRAATPALSPWLDVSEAADYLRCKPKRIYDVVAQSRLPVHRDGSRLLFHRDELDSYLNAADTSLTPSPDSPASRRSRAASRTHNPRVGEAG
jgi:excisionase family DNA binding protein